MGKNRQKDPEGTLDEKKAKKKALKQKRKRQQSAFSRYAEKLGEDILFPQSKEPLGVTTDTLEGPPPKKEKRSGDTEVSQVVQVQPSESKNVSSSRGPRSSSGHWEVRGTEKESRCDDEDNEQKQTKSKKRRNKKSTQRHEHGIGCDEVMEDSREKSPPIGNGSHHSPGKKSRNRDRRRKQTARSECSSSQSHRRRDSSPESQMDGENGSPKQENKDSSPEVRVFVLDAEHCLVVTKLPGHFGVWGQASIQCLFGEVEILGSVLRQGSPSVDVYSPNTSSFLSIWTHPHNSLSKEGPLNDYLDKMLANNDQLKTEIQFYVSLDENSVVLLFSKPKKKKRLDFVTAIQQFRGIFWSPDMQGGFVCHKPVGSLPIAICPLSRPRSVRIRSDMRNLANKFVSEIEKENNPVVSVCGGKNVGKSTLSRYLVNSALNKCKRIAYLDCDVGQTECSPPGCVSLHVITSPLLGPPFTHQRKAIKMIYFGATTPSDDPGHYLNCVRHAYSAYMSLDTPCPLVVNTMGWNQGLGLVLLASTLRCIKPGYVVQIMSTHNRNFPEITPQFIDDQDNWPGSEVDSQEPPATHDLIIIQSAVTNPATHGRYSPADHRMMSLLSYLSRYQPSTGPCIPLHAVAPQIVNWADLALHVTHAAVPNSQILYSLNASVVGLCCVPEEMILSSEDDTLPKFLATKPICNCIGFGVVRAIDPLNKTFAIISNIKIGPSTGVNCLIRGLVDLPQSLINSQPSVEGEIPYYGVSKDVIGATAITRRRHLLRRGRMGNKEN